MHKQVARDLLGHMDLQTTILEVKFHDNIFVFKWNSKYENYFTEQAQDLVHESIVQMIQQPLKRRIVNIYSYVLGKKLILTGYMFNDKLEFATPAKKMLP